MACAHYMVRHEFCNKCKSSVDTRRNGFIPFNYLGHGLKIRSEYVGSMKRQVWIESLKEKKLVLVLGLRGTLYFPRRVSLLTEKERYLIGEVNSRSDLWLSNTVFSDHGEALCKLRPFVHEFLREANKLFKMYVFELNNPTHVEEVISIIDPQGYYFGTTRIITPIDRREMKTLDLVLAEERGLVILDDKNDYWWPDDVTNLLQIAPYEYFKRPEDSWILKFVNMFKKSLSIEPISYAEERGDEGVKDGGLANALELLKELHYKFFNEKDVNSRDVRKLLFP